jgi:hypothetical protein
VHLPVFVVNFMPTTVYLMVKFHKKWKQYTVLATHAFLLAYTSNKRMLHAAVGFVSKYKFFLTDMFVGLLAAVKSINSLGA